METKSVNMQVIKFLWDRQQERDPFIMIISKEAQQIVRGETEEKRARGDFVMCAAAIAAISVHACVLQVWNEPTCLDTYLREFTT
jgi:hypothetical protein